jgi:hypothetical protein
VLPLSRRTLSYVAGVIRRHRARIGSFWRKLIPAGKRCWRRGFAERVPGFPDGIPDVVLVAGALPPPQRCLSVVPAMRFRPAYAGLGPARGGLRACRAQAADSAQQAEPELGTRDESNDRDQKADENQDELPAGVAVAAEDPALIEPVAPRFRLRAVAGGTPADRQARCHCRR